MANGGYQVVDFKNVVLSETPVTISGIYKKVSTGKAILCENLLLGESAIPITIFSCATPVDAGMSITIVLNGVYTANILVTDADAVSVTVTKLAEAE